MIEFIGFISVLSIVLHIRSYIFERKLMQLLESQFVIAEAQNKALYALMDNQIDDEAI